MIFRIRNHPPPRFALRILSGIAALVVGLGIALVCIAISFRAKRTAEPEVSAGRTSSRVRHEIGLYGMMKAKIDTWARRLADRGSGNTLASPAGAR